ncbi:hypothetical protein [Christiangramia sp. SM2212]|uniref:Leucine-rich repeat domain-containing protein n=1 Tax=Christiangramia sediminicola TaxID=3073267 RepID=A0ABU1ERY4_9FLAO|nr:hypothetical protein [Christiangramia sp. SM2212]MDR5591136.1 hypothetical protein [Christiangramia sp. SM2212]
MRYIYIIINPRFRKYSLINSTNQSLEKITSELNDKYANPEIANDFYKVVYSKEIDGDISDTLIGLKEYKLPESEFYNIKGNLAIEILESESYEDDISEDELINWWDSLNLSWKYTFEKKIYTQTRRGEEGSNFDKITIKELRELLLIENLTLWRKGIKSLEPLKLFKQLKILNCGDMDGFTDLEPLSELYKLEELNIVNTKIKSLQPISKLLNLRRLYCFKTQVNSMNAILHLTNFEIIKTNYNIPNHELRIIRKNNPYCKIN